MPATREAKLAYTVQEACAATGLSRSTIYNLIRAGDLTKVRVGGRTLLPACDLRRLFDPTRKGE